MAIIRKYLIDPLRRWYFGAPPEDDLAQPIYIRGEDDGRLPIGGSDLDDAALIEAELAYMRRPESGHDAATPSIPLPADDRSRSCLTGLALSGGGIRSATFSLGVMQRLAKAGILRHIDYLSTVSGGGYIGSGLSWWLSGKSGSPHQYGVGRDDFPYGTDEPGTHWRGTKILTRLRHSGQYLVPGSGITIWSGVAVVLRAILLNLIVWIPAFATVFFVLLKLKDHMPIVPVLLERDDTLFQLMVRIAIALLMMFVFASVNFSLLSWTSRDEGGRDGTTQRPRETARWRRIARRLCRRIGVLLLVAADIFLLVILILFVFGDSLAHQLTDPIFSVIVGGLIVIAVVRMLIRRRRDSREKRQNRLRGLLILLGFAALVAADFILEHLEAPVWASRSLLVVFAVGLFVAYNFWMSAGVQRLLRVAGLSLRYGARRNFEKIFGYVLLAIGGLLVLYSIPVVHGWAQVQLQGGLLGVVAGAASAIWGHLRSKSEGGDGLGTSIVLISGCGLLIYGVLILAYDLALAIEGEHQEILLALILLALFSGWFTNINYISIHRYYRDRLMEAFLPDFETVCSGKPGPARAADDLQLSDLWQKRRSGPFHIINANVVLVNSEVQKYRTRGGDNFILTPAYSGSNATGWQRSDVFMQGDVTLASAMAISGAAANPRAGVAGKGLTRNRVVSLVMTLLNFRLGYYVRRPGRNGTKPSRPNHYYPGAVFAIPGFGCSERSGYLELSDGGHFENLGIYELVRRRCALIIVCDGGQDAQASYGDFVTALHRIGQDFGATVHFDVEMGGKMSGPQDLIARPRHDTYPKGAEYASKGYFLATVDYGRRGGDPWPRKGLLIYMKTTMIEALKMEAKGYKGAHPDFPDQTTADQFFDEEQFESYREVGYRIAEQMIGDLDLESKFAKGRPAVSELLAPDPRRRPGLGD